MAAIENLDPKTDQKLRACQNTIDVRMAPLYQRLSPCPHVLFLRAMFGHHVEFPLMTS
jgi:hypothetical protein